MPDNTALFVAVSDTLDDVLMQAARTTFAICFFVWYSWLWDSLSWIRAKLGIFLPNPTCISGHWFRLLMKVCICLFFGFWFPLFCFLCSFSLKNTWYISIDKKYSLILKNKRANALRQSAALNWYVFSSKSQCRSSTLSLSLFTSDMK